MVGERLKAARAAAGLSMRELAKKADISPMAVSKYERGLDIPGSAVLLRMAKALGIKAEYLLRPNRVAAVTPAFRRRASLPKKQEEAIIARVQDWLERYSEIEEILGQEVQFRLPAEFSGRIEKQEDTEAAAQKLRRVWRLGEGPIENVVDLLEDHGIKVGTVDGHDDFDALTFWSDKNRPVIITKSGITGDRQRLCLVHELAHLVLNVNHDLDEEKVATRFAAAFLAPEPAVRFELGSSRKVINTRELYFLKLKYGLSMQGWIYRAKDAGVISEPAAVTMFRVFSSNGWRKMEPWNQVPAEEPRRMQRLVLRALSEGFISPSRASELLEMPLTTFYYNEAAENEVPTPDLCN
jgi:transcriptional regulator with XRE-family HTH domain